jgi:hypothetical protein
MMSSLNSGNFTVKYYTELIMCLLRRNEKRTLRVYPKYEAKFYEILLHYLIVPCPYDSNALFISFVFLLCFFVYLGISTLLSFVLIYSTLYFWASLLV